MYIIEPKKDFGNDDAYRQTADYLDWFEQSAEYRDKFMDCLNSLTKELVEADIRKEVGSWRSSSSSLDEG